MSSTHTDTEIRFERFDLGQGMRLSVISTPKLKTLLVKAFMTADLDEAFTRRALLPLVLRRGTSRSPDIQAMQHRLDDLYGSSVAADVMKVGEWHPLSFRLESVNGAFLPGHEDVFRDALSFLRELIFDPRLERANLREDYVAQESENLRRMIESLVDDKGPYALQRLIENMAADEPFRRYEQGDVADLEGVDARRLTEDWRVATRDLPMEIYVAGDVDANEIRDLVAETFVVERRGDFTPAPVPGFVPVGEQRTVTESLAINQGKLCLGFRHENTYSHGDLEASVMMNGILGGFSHSKLFQNVREKASLAYVAHSGLERVKGFLFISSGIAIENFEKARDICLEQVEALRRGDISEEELSSTRESFDNQLAMLEDNLSGLIDSDYVWGLNGRSFDLHGYRKRLREVTRERIVAAAESLELDTIYFLRD